MKTLTPLLIVCIVVASGITAFFFVSGENDPIRLTGVVVANEVIVAAETGGRIRDLSVNEGSWVTIDEVIAVLDSEELEAEKRRQQEIINQLSAKLNQARERVNLERARSPSEMAGAEAKLRLARSQRDEAIAEWDQLKKDADRTWGLVNEGLLPKQEGEQRETSMRVVEARIRSLTDQITAAQAALELARANERQVRIAIQEVEQNRAQLAQAEADLAKITARLDYTVVRAPLNGMISLRVARQGEVVNAGDPIVTIMDLDDVWVRAELEESYIDRLVVGQPVAVRVPSGEEITGEVIFVAPEAGFATQRDVSRVKRDIRTFGIKVALPNPNRRLHAGMTAYVMLPDEVTLSARNRREYESDPGAGRDERFERTVEQLERVVRALEQLVAENDSTPSTVQGDYLSTPAESVPDLPLGSDERSLETLDNENMRPWQKGDEPEGGDKDLDKLINSLQTLIADYEQSKSRTPEVDPLGESVASASNTPQTGPTEPVPAEPDEPDRPFQQNSDPLEVVNYIQELLRRSDTESLTALGLAESTPRRAEDLPAEADEAAGSPPLEASWAGDPGGEETTVPTAPYTSPAAGGIPEAVWSPLSELVLQGTAVIGEIPVALVNNQHIFEGDLYEEARVVKIDDGAVEFEYAGRRFTVRF